MMIKCAYLMLAISVMGCADDSEPMELGPVPGMNAEASSNTVNRHGSTQPCGFDVTQDNSQPGAPPAHYMWSGRYTYDTAGNLRSQRDLTDPVSYSTYEYDATGNVLRMTIGSEVAGDVPTVFVYGYDAFGRLIRSAWDVGNDGVEDEVATYTYADGARSPSLRSVRHPTTQVNGAPYDKTYHYDDLGRLTGYDLDNGPDGTIDMTGAVVYDDAARTRTLTEHDAAGTVTQIVFDEFRRSQYLAHELTTDFTTEDGPWYTDDAWQYDGERSTGYTDRLYQGSLSATPWLDSTTTYRYSGCK